MLTGRQPFEGKTAVEILSQQQTQPFVPPDEWVKSVPQPLSAIVLKMAARRPEDRYAGMGDVIRDLEGIAGISKRGRRCRRRRRAGTLLEQNAVAWHDSPSARLRAKVTLAILAACLGLALLCWLPGWWLAATAFASLGLFIALADFTIVGLRRKTPLFQRFTALVLGSSLSERLTGLASFALLVGLLLFFKLFWIWMALALAAVGIVSGLRALEQRSDAERRGPLELAESIVRSLRRHGHDEDLVRQFVCTSCGQHWEELYEALFGYESMLAARDRWGRVDRPERRPRFAPWRRPIIRWIDARLAVRREAKELAVLQKFEERESGRPGREPGDRPPQSRACGPSHGGDRRRNPGNDPPREGTIMVNRSIAEAMREAAIKPETVLLEHERGFRRPRPRDRTKLLAKLANIVLRPQDPVPGRRRASGRLHRLDAPERDDLGGTREGARRGGQVWRSRLPFKRTPCPASPTRGRKPRGRRRCSICPACRRTVLAARVILRRGRRRAHPDRLVVCRGHAHRVLRDSRRGDPGRWPPPGAAVVAGLDPSVIPSIIGAACWLRAALDESACRRIRCGRASDCFDRQSWINPRRRRCGGCGRVISSRIVVRPEVVVKRSVGLDDLRAIGVVLLLQQLVQPPEAIMRHGGKQVMGDVHVLSVHEDRPPGEEIGEEHPRVGQAARRSALECW